ncbi:MAG: tetratricopeptide repeat protein [Proteobacteria bacterium]|nr:tetratricopeptide repeat protein [Pseudomonadota bacterium]
MPFSRRHLWDLFAIFAILAVVAGVYAQTAGHGFFILDDNLVLQDDPRVAGGITATGVARAFGLTGPTYWSPPSTLAHMAAYAAFGENPVGHHLALAALHLLAALALYLALRSLTGAPGKSAFAALIFAAHPVNVESVAWVAQYRTVLSALFFFLCLDLYARYARAPSRGRYLAMAVAFFLAVASKPVVAAMPLALLALDFWPLARFSGQGRGAGRGALALVAEKLPLLALSLGVLGVMILGGPSFGLSLGGSFGSSPGLGLRLAAALTGVADYLGSVFLGWGLSVYRPYPAAVATGQAILAGALVVLVSLAVAFQARRRPWLLTGWAWFLAGLIPVSGLAQWGAWPATADRFLYVPAVGLFVAVVWLLAGFLERATATRATAAVLGGAAVAVLAWTAVGQTSLWADNRTLLARALDLDPDNCVALRLLGDDAADRDRPREALEYYDRSLALCPNQAQAYKGAADILSRGDRLDRAVGLYQKAVEANPLYWTARHNLAAALARLGRVGDAAREFAATAQIAPNDALTRLNLGMCLAQLGRLEEAREQYEKAISIRPDLAPAYLRLGDIYALAGQAPDAARCYGMAVRLDPDLAEARESFERLLTGREREAAPAPEPAPRDRELEELLAFLERDPENPVIHNNLGALYEARGKTDRAEFHYRRALILKPGYAKAANNLGVLVMHRGDFEAARELLEDAAAREPENVAPAYNLACLHSLMENGEKSLFWLEEAVRRGLSQRSLVETDPDLAFLRETRDLAPVLASMP